MNDAALAALNVESLSFSYGEKQVLSEVSFGIKKGEFLALLGPNGAGKSTLFALLTHLLRPGSGHIDFGGYPLAKEPRKALSKLGIVFQQSTLDLDLTVAQNLHYHASLHGLGAKQARQRIADELARLDMRDALDRKIRQLNGGHRRRVEIARALLHQPSTLLLDEATVGLDLDTREAIGNHVRYLCKEDNIAVLWATHLIDELTSEDQIMIMHRGNLVAHGQVQALLQTHQLESLRSLYAHHTAS